MNYFERLVRRALRQPRAIAGSPLDDPFETVAPWPLEAPGPAAALPPPPVEASRHPAVVEDAAAPPATSLEPSCSAPLPAPARGEAVAATSEAAAPQSVTLAPPTAIRPPSSARLEAERTRTVDAPRAPQRAADEFMRSLGVPPPSDETSDATPRNAYPSPATAVPTPPPGETPRNRRDEMVQLLLPPPAPRVFDLRPPPRPPVVERAPSKAGVQRDAPPRRSQQQLQQRLQPLIVVGAGSMRSNDGEPTGCGAPHFGLGQL